MLTKKQYELLVFIDKRLNATGVSPSFDEMKDALGLRSKSGIHRLITGLEERGFIRRLAHRARALEVVKLPENMDKPAGVADHDPSSGFTPNVIKGDFGIPGTASSENSGADLVQLPLYGRIAAGAPIEAMRDPSNMIDIPASMISGGDHFALEIDGESMIDAGILDGDTVLIKKANTAESGTIVVALVEGYEVTLKRLRKRGDSIALEPANKDYETRIFGPDQVQVQGKLVGLLRKY